MLLDGQAGTVGELTDEVTRISKVFKPDFRDPEELWFRGQKHAHQNLLPDLYREDTRCFNYDECSLMERFRQLAIAIVVSQPVNEWDWYFLARHHGLPSRLLDWTESLLTALFFALEKHIPKSRLDFDELADKPPAEPLYNDDSPVIWMLDAGSLNNAAVGDDSLFVPGVEKDKHEVTWAYTSETIDDTSANNTLPLAILPARSNTRISAQQGMFTIHGRQRTPIEQLAIGDDRMKLARIRIDTSRIPHLWHQLEIAGVNRVTLFPDLDSVVRHVCWTHQSAV